MIRYVLLALSLVACEPVIQVGRHDAGFEVEDPCANCSDSEQCCGCFGCFPQTEACPNAMECEPLEPDCRYEGRNDCTCGRRICMGECDGLPGGECAPGTFCNFTDGCGLEEQAGMCDPIPMSCSDVCEEVCACDGNTYCNACEAARRGLDFVSRGPC